MSFDAAILDSRTLSQKGVKFIVRDPRTNRPHRNDAKEEVYITLLGRNSERFEQINEATRTLRADMAARGIEFTNEHAHQERVTWVAGCTTGWNIDILDGKPFPYTEANAQLFWEDKRFNWLLNQAAQFLLDEANFLADTLGG